MQNLIIVNHGNTPDSPPVVIKEMKEENKGGELYGKRKANNKNM